MQECEPKKISLHRNTGRRFLFTSGLAAALLLTLVLALPPAGAQEPRTRLSEHGAWTAYVLEKGRLRVCYVETKPFAASAGVRELGDVRLQVTHRSLNSASDLVRFTTNQYLPYSVILNSANPSTLDSLLDPMEGDPDTSFVEDMKAAEAKHAQAQLVLWSNLNLSDLDFASATSQAVYSLHGFTKAYDAIRAHCSNRPAQDASRQPITVTGISPLQGSPLSSEFSLTGPFFQASEAERLTIRAIPGGFTDADVDLATLSPEDRFIYGSQRLEFYRDDELIYVDENSQHSNDITGVCLDPSSGQLKILMRTWSGSATYPPNTLAVHYVPGVGIVEEFLDSSQHGSRILDCSKDESQWQWGGHFLACQCAGRAGKDVYYSALDGLASDIERFGGVREDSQGRINEATFSSLLSRLSELDPFVRWDALSSFDVQRLDSEKFTVVALTYTAHDRPYSSVQSLFVRRRTEDFWTPIYQAPLSSKGIHTVTLYGFLDEQTVDLKMCVENCDSWGKSARVKKNLEEWTENVAPQL